MLIRERDFSGHATGGAVAQLSALMKEREKTKRLLIGAAGLLFIVGAVVLVFAPQGRETISVILGGVLIVFALGAIGAATFKCDFPACLFKPTKEKPADPSPLRISGGITARSNS